MRHNGFRSCLLILLLASAIHAQKPDVLIRSVGSIPGWKESDKPTTFVEPTIQLFDAKLTSILRTYGIKSITRQSWQGPSGQIRVTLFELSDASAAYGFFTNQRKRESTSNSALSAGTESFEGRSGDYFWQSRFVVQLEGERQSVDTLAVWLSQNILGRSQRPPVSNRLPTSNLVAGSEEYILAASNMDKVEGVNPANLGFDESAEAASANYRINGKTVRLVLILYPTQQLAKKYADRINAASPNLAEFRKRIGPLIAIVSNTSEASVIQPLLDQVHYSSRVTWSEPKPGLGLGPIIVTVFTFIGLLLAASVFAGFGLGGVRILMKRLYPNRVFDRPEDVGIIQLKLDQELTRKELGEP